MTSVILEIKEILGPSEQGLQTPYKCRADDGSIYFVKGLQTNRTSLWSEWICAHLGQEFGLNIPPFSLVHVSKALLAEVNPEWRSLGVGIAFGSKNHPSAAWLEPSMVKLVPASVQKDVLIFDWWVHNSDRLTSNPNLLWDSGKPELVIIDHNLAFDPDFSDQIFLQHHIFASQWDEISRDLSTMAEFSKRLSNAYKNALQRACDNAPDEWNWENPERDLLSRFVLDNVKALLLRCETLALWKVK